MNLQSKNRIPDTAIQKWISAFLTGYEHAALFSDEALWRDYLGVAWDLKTHEGREQILAALPDNIGTQDGAIEPLSDNEVIFHFHGPNGLVKALAEFRDGNCVRLFTSLEEMPAGPALPEQGVAPFVMIIGAGQSGLALAAQLQHLHIPYQVIERNPRIGDNWRGRYDALVLHDPAWVNHMPFKPFPADWPTYTPKDMMGDWLESYAESLSLNVVCNCSVSAAKFNEEHQIWQVSLEEQNATRQINVPNLVFAVGTSGFAHKPEFPGAGDFSGQQIHSSAYVSGAGFSGKNIVIIGATNSAHDIAVDLVKHGAKPTLVQRSSTHVIPHKAYVDDLLGPLYAPDHNRTLKEADFLSMATPIRLLETRARSFFNTLKDKWSGFYDALTQAGFAIDFAEDGTGIIGKYRRTASGYYIDVGGSQRLIDGEIAVRSGVDVKTITAETVLLSDGSALAADAIIYATGFGSMEEWVEKLIDHQTAEKIGTCWGYGSGYRGDKGPWEGELRNMWKPTAQEGLWFMGGNLAQVRIYSRYLAYQLCHKMQKGVL